MPAHNTLISRLKSELEKSPLASNIIFSLILACLEKLVEMDFSCLCNPKWNWLFVMLFFIAPGSLISMLMLNIQGWDSKKPGKEQIKPLVSIIFPSLVWVILLLCDGQYVACAISTQSGRYVVVDKAAHQKQCLSDNNNTSQELVNIHNWYSGSQAAGMVIILLVGILGIYFKQSKLNKDKGTQDPEDPASTSNEDKETQYPEDSALKSNEDKETQYPEDSALKSYEDKETQYPEDPALKSNEKEETQDPKVPASKSNEDKETQDPDSCTPLLSSNS